jgi:hypothetical protein
MAAYRKIGDRRGRLRFEVVGPAWGALETAPAHAQPDPATSGIPADTVVPAPPRPAQPVAARWSDWLGTGPSKPFTETPARATVQLLDISVTGALLASTQRFGLGQSAALRATLDGEAFDVEINVQHVNPGVTGVDAPNCCRLGVMFVSHNERSLGCIQRFLGQTPA